MSAGHGHDDRHLDPPRVEEVADRVFAYIQPDGTWWINNTGFVVADDGIVAIDTCATERRTRAFLASRGAVSPPRAARVVGSHHPVRRAAETPPRDARNARVRRSVAQVSMATAVGGADEAVCWSTGPVRLDVGEAGRRPPPPRAVQVPVVVAVAGAHAGNPTPSRL
jgi:hypothetical protein